MTVFGQLLRPHSSQDDFTDRLQFTSQRSRLLLSVIRKEERVDAATHPPPRLRLLKASGDPWSGRALGPCACEPWCETAIHL